MRPRLPSVLLVLAVLMGPLGAQARSDGEKALAEFEEKGAVYAGPLVEYVQRVGDRMLRAAQQDPERYTFTVLDDPSINAFAVDGGYIFVARGLLAYLENEDQLPRSANSGAEARALAPPSWVF
jgi:predicted Zn-dependent protease